MIKQIDQSYTPKESVQCRICHDEDKDSNMDTPCSCSGTLKYAHKRCVQRWCNEKGDTTCEICQQQFKGYISQQPAPLFHYDGSPIHYGENWEISRRDFRNHRFIAFFDTNVELIDSDVDYPAPSTRSLMCCRIVAIIFMVLLIVRQTLPIILILNGSVEEYSLTVFLLTVWGITGIFVPVYIMLKAYTAIQRLQYQDHHEENEMGGTQLRIIHVQ